MTRDPEKRVAHDQDQTRRRLEEQTQRLGRPDGTLRRQRPGSRLGHSSACSERLLLRRTASLDRSGADPTRERARFFNGGTSGASGEALMFRPRWKRSALDEATTIWIENPPLRAEIT